jgi:hypothetical protein
MSSVGCLIVAAHVLYCGFFHALSNLPIEQPLFFGVQQRFWLHPMMLTSFLGGLGVHELFTTWIPLFINLLTQSGESGPRKSPSVATAGIAAAVAVASSLIAAGWADNDESRNDAVENFGRALIEPLPPHSVLFTSGDLVLNSARTVQEVLGVRRDVIILDQEMMTYPWHVTRAAARFGVNTSSSRRSNPQTVSEVPGFVFPGTYYFPGRKGTFDMASLLMSNGLGEPGKRRAFVAYKWKDGDNSAIQRGYTLRRFGLVFEVIAPTPVKPAQSEVELRLRKYIAELANALPSAAARVALPADIARYDETSWEHTAASDLAGAMQHTAHALLSAVQELKRLTAGAPGVAKPGEGASHVPVLALGETDADVCARCENASVWGTKVVNGRDVFLSSASRPSSSAPGIAPQCHYATSPWLAHCALDTVVQLLRNAHSRFPPHTHSDAFRNMAATVQELMELPQPMVVPKTATGLAHTAPVAAADAAAASAVLAARQKRLVVTMVAALQKYVELATVEGIPHSEVAPLDAALGHYQTMLANL